MVDTSSLLPYVITSLKPPTGTPSASDFCPRLQSFWLADKSDTLSDECLKLVVCMKRHHTLLGHTLHELLMSSNSISSIVFCKVVMFKNRGYGFPALYQHVDMVEFVDKLPTEDVELPPRCGRIRRNSHEYDWGPQQSS